MSGGRRAGCSPREKHCCTPCRALGVRVARPSPSCRLPEDPARLERAQGELDRGGRSSAVTDGDVSPPPRPVGCFCLASDCTHTSKEGSKLFLLRFSSVSQQFPQLQIKQGNKFLAED